MARQGGKNGTDERPKDGAPDQIIGIDLGMTSVISAYVSAPGKPPRVIPLEKGLPSLPAVVGFRGKDAPVVGRAAQDMLTTAPDQTVTGIKRLLGRKMTSQAVRDLNTRVGYEIVAGDDNIAAVAIGDKKIPPPEIAALLLSRVKSFAEAHLGQPTRRCVVAVPAYFSATQKAAVKKAGQIAGLEVVKLVHEPTAVALAYGFNKSGGARIAIIDMGGVRLDISVMEIAGNVFDVVATGGDAYLGGANIDARLAEWILTNIKKQFGRDLSQEAQLLMKVRTAAEQAKRELTRFKAVDLQIPLNVTAPGMKAKIAQLRLTRDTVESLTEDLAQRVVALVRQVLGQRKLDPGDVDEIILVGGASRSPLIRSKCVTLFGKEPRSTIPPEEVIALGAALLAESLGRADDPGHDILDTPIGIALSDGRFMRIIDKDSKLPITRRVMIPTVRDHQRNVEVDIFQGDSTELIDTEYLGTVVFRDVPDAKAGDAKLVVDLSLGADRLLLLTSPEDGRAGEKFEFKTKGHADRENADPAPKLVVAQNLPRPASSPA